MSVPQVEVPQSDSSPKPSSSAPRKRRKRAPAAGAAADCFTCSSLSISCDRRRPFCSQCLENGKDCSGYKTQLTWGVGVASRGKLRGLSLPIAGSTQRASGPISPTKKRKRFSISERKQLAQGTAQAPGNVAKLEPLSPKQLRSGPSISYSRNGIAPTSASWLQPTTANPTTTSTAPISIKSESFEPSLSTYNFGSMNSNQQDRYSGPSPTTSYGMFSTNNTDSPKSYSTSPRSAYLRPTMTEENAFRHVISDPRTYRTYDLPSSESNGNTVIHSIFQYEPHSYYQDDITSLRPKKDGPQTFPMATNGMGVQEEVVEEIGRGNTANDIAVIDDMSLLESPLPIDFHFNLAPFGNMSTVGKTPRLQYLINYYAEVISPVIVAFDGPSNPYRTHILRLAAESETLQHAIAALSASNLRQRRETGVISSGKTAPARRSSTAHLTLTDESFHGAALLSPQEQAREETFYKGFAIRSLNAQLADPVLRKDDSILATLLVLCLFHICDSGVARFQTQFAGVKKLLSLRGSEQDIQTKGAKWITRMFTLFDAMAATVNDREGQLRGHHLDTTAFSDEEWSLENLAGCDGKLFKTIAKLGRLNVLGRGMPVEESPTIISRPLPNLLFPTLDYGNFDGNGWARIIADEDLFITKTANPEPQEQFWREWREVRQALQTWKLDTSLFDSNSSEAPLLSVDQRVDLANISESFRYSALLYTERLKSPQISSSDPSIRLWVQQSLTFIKQVKSDVYLLWPLFITGSECVDEADISVIRERCLDIQRDSGFFNNQSCLELLEKVWKRRDNQTSPNGYPSGDVERSGFRFSEVMKAEGNDGEYLVV